MQTLFYCLLILLSALLYSCDGNNESNDEQLVFNPVSEDTFNPNEPLYPFTDYIQGQLRHIDTTPFAIEKVVALDGKTIDSQFTNRQELRALATQFTEIDPNDLALKLRYKETSFNDLTINRLTFSITAMEKDMPLQQADILLNPDNMMVKTVMLRKQFSRGDSSIQQNLLWINNMHFQISETITKSDNKSYTRVTRLVWDKPLQ